MKILLVLSEPSLVESLSAELHAAGFTVVTGDESTVDGQVASGGFEAIVIDSRPRDDSLLSVLPLWRQQGVTSHVLVLLNEEADSQQRIKYLELGADMLLPRPFQGAELIARLRALMRRTDSKESDVSRIHDLEIDPSRRTVHRGGASIRLTRREFALLEFLISRRGKVVNRNVIHEHVFPSVARHGSNVVDVYVRYLRRKIDPGRERSLIVTHWGVGYEFRDDGVAPA